MQTWHRWYIGQRFTAHRVIGIRFWHPAVNLTWIPTGAGDKPLTWRQHAAALGIGARSSAYRITPRVLLAFVLRRDPPQAH